MRHQTGPRMFSNQMYLALQYPSQTGPTPIVIETTTLNQRTPEFYVTVQIYTGYTMYILAAQVHGPGNILSSGQSVRNKQNRKS